MSVQGERVYDVKFAMIALNFPGSYLRPFSYLYGQTLFGPGTPATSMSYDSTR